LKESALYIHIPFCDHKCIYCDFYSIITEDNIQPFLNSVKKEIEYYSEYYSHNRIFTSIFFGGGTPSLMKPKYLGEIINLLRTSYSVSDDAEITMETNPGTVDKNKLTDFLQIGINRISIGVQSFNNEELNFLTRIHDKQTAVDTINSVYEIGFKNISLDLIFNLPGQSKDKWKHNLETAVSLPINHISTYSLILERGTILNKMVLDRKVKIQNEDHDADLYELTIDYLLSKNFYQYEVSNFCKPGFECRHNNAYWRYKDYLSFGTSAHSFMSGKRWWNFSSLKKYISEIESKGNAVANFEILNDEQKLNEYVMLALRSKGIDLMELKNNFGSQWMIKNYSYLKELNRNSLVNINEDFILLTQKGYAVCDEIVKNLVL
jgi:oxygen-independent coproporphyrinogen-3 oxidase